MLKVESWLQNWLISQPEYRMGYQKVTVKLNSGGMESGVIINSQVFLKTTETENIPWQLFHADWTSVLIEAEKSALKVVDVTLIPREPETLKGVRHIVLANEKYKVMAARKEHSANFSMGVEKVQHLLEARQFLIKAANSAAEDAPITLTGSSEIFKRFSAYANDKRITPGKGLTAGTFATTKEDADAHVKTGMDAVARYALPNSKPANHVFTISPAKDTELKRGVAQPAYGQPGGGIEVIFVNGLPDGTVTGPVVIPER